MEANFVKNPKDVDVRLYVNQAKNGQMVALEKLGKRMVAALREVHSGREFFFNAKYTSIQMAGIHDDLIRLELPHEEDPKIYWNPGLVEAHDIKKEESLGKLATEGKYRSDASSKDIKWCL